MVMLASTNIIGTVIASVQQAAAIFILLYCFVRRAVRPWSTSLKLA